MDIYDTKHRVQIVDKLPTQLGIHLDDVLYKCEHKLFDIYEINCILDIISPKLYELKIDESILMNDNEIIEKFNKKHYPVEKPVRYNKHEMKIIESMYCLKRTYLRCREEKSRIVLEDRTSIETNNEHVKDKKQIKEEKKNVKKKEKEMNIMYCVATKMDGTICNCKTKKNSNLCGRHSKK